MLVVRNFNLNNKQNHSKNKQPEWKRELTTNLLNFKKNQRDIQLRTKNQTPKFNF